MTKEVLLELMEAKKLKAVHDVLSHYNSVDLALLLSELNQKDLALVFRILSKEKAAEVFSYLDNSLRQELLSSFTDKEIIQIIENMYSDDVVDFLEDMPANLVTRLLQQIDKNTRNEINQLLQYPNNSAGSLMTTEFIELQPQFTVLQAIEQIRNKGMDSETIYTCYVVEKHKLLGIVTVKNLLIASENTVVSEIMKRDYIYVNANDDKEVAANLFRKYGLIAIPVLDSEGYVVGIITFDDAIEVLTNESTEDIHKMAAIHSTDTPYLKTSIFMHAKSRIMWLLVLMLSATITGAIIAKYENAFTVIPILVSFIPMLMDTGGNCGSQSATLIIRGLAVDELHFHDFFKIVWMEFRVSMLVGIALAIVNGIRVLLFYKSASLALVVGVSLTATIIIAKMVGCMLPILAKRCRIDPAIMAAPLITTIVDTLSIIIYFGIATVVFKL